MDDTKKDEMKDFKRSIFDYWCKFNSCRNQPNFWRGDPTGVPK